MKKTLLLDDKLRQMLELLAEGASTQGLAKTMGYSEGTVRVYLHNLYRALGVRNRTEAVLWHVRAAQEARLASEARALSHDPQAAAIPATFGEAAEAGDLLGALGVMESFLGPYGRLWEVALRLKGTELDAVSAARQASTRSLWRALLAADFGYGKRLCDSGKDTELMRQSPEAVLLVLLLQAGGYTHAGDRAMARLNRRGEATVPARELELLQALRSALYQQDDVALGVVHRLATAASTPPVVKHLAMVSLYYAYLARKDAERARRTADALWSEAERARGQLAAMGVRPFAADAAVPSPTRGEPKREATRTKATSAR